MMTEEKKPEDEKPEEEDKKEPAAPDAAVHNPADLISNANSAAERLESANKELSKLLVRQEALRVEATLGGEASAGQPLKTKEQVEIDGAKKLLEGTGLEDEAFPDESNS